MSRATGHRHIPPRACCYRSLGMGVNACVRSVSLVERSAFELDGNSRSTPAMHSVPAFDTNRGYVSRNPDAGQRPGERLLFNMGVVECACAEDRSIRSDDAPGVGIVFPSGIHMAHGHIEAPRAASELGTRVYDLWFASVCADEERGKAKRADPE